MEIGKATKRLIGFFICWRCHRQFPLYERQSRKYCDDCLPLVASDAGKRGGRGNKKRSDGNKPKGAK